MEEVTGNEGKKAERREIRGTVEWKVRGDYVEGGTESKME